MKLTIAGHRSNQKLVFSLPKKYVSNFPLFFIIKIDTNEIILRKRGQRLIHGKHTKYKLYQKEYREKNRK